LKVFHLSPTGAPVLGEPPAQREAPKARAPREPRPNIELGGSFDEMAQRFSKIKVPRVSGSTLGIAAAVVLIWALGAWLLIRQSLKTRAEIVARAVMNPESVKTVVDLAVPETAMDVIRWHSQANLKYNELKLALGGIDSSLTLNILADGSDGMGVV